MNKLKLYLFLSATLAILGSCDNSNKNKNNSYSPESGLPSWALGPFIRAQNNPVISPQKSSEFFCPMQQMKIKWEESDAFNPAATVKDGKIIVLYRAEDNTSTGIGSRTSRIGYAESVNGIHMAKRNSPVLYPDDDNFKAMEWKGGCEDPRVVMAEDGLYVMLYTGWNRENGVGAKKNPRLCVATSIDLINWTKHGLAFGKAYNGRFKDLDCKSASIVTSLKDNKIVTQKIDGKYFMYWGERAVCAAISDDLINWEPVLDDNNNLLEIAKPRHGYFDSRLTECGPPALMTEDGIVLIYNGKNGYKEERDPNYPAGTYAAGQFLFDKNDPFKVLDRLDKPFFWPDADFEKSGQYPDGTVFTEGLAYLNGRYYLYYGCADSFVALATFDEKKNN